ncbi:MAG TPA: EpsI family protein [Pyrinomonadaceae bacterium]|nr:EpsI family protein [Pyrinomonadaceae bacterium]
MKGSVRFTLVLVVIFVAGIVVNSWTYLGEKPVVRKELKDFPPELGNWKQVGSDQIFDKDTLSVLRASDYLMRDYRTADGQVANFYVGYYATQRDGATYHSPLNCLPGSGWTMSDPGQVTITSPDGNTFAANRYLIQNGDQKSLLIYWYQGRGRAIASEYWGKVYTVLDSVRLRRSDGAMVRVITPMDKSTPEALHSAVDLAANATRVLPQFVPD